LRVYYDCNETVRQARQTIEEETMPWLYGEPTLEDMLADPTVNVLMERDEVDPDDLRMFLEDVSDALGVNRDMDAT
jgi:hypothetical protein